MTEHDPRGEPDEPDERDQPGAATSARRDAATERPTVVAAAVRTWLRYLVPLTVLSAIALAPAVVVALRTRVPRAPSGIVTTGWVVLATAWIGQLVLVGGAAAVAREARSQLGALAAGFAQLVRAIVPCLLAAAAIALGGLALALPGLVLLVLLSLTGASRERGLPAPLRDSLAVVRADPRPVAITVAAMLVLDAVIGVYAYRAYAAALPRHPSPAELAALPGFVRAIVIALVVASPLPATVLATIRVRADQRER